MAYRSMIRRYAEPRTIQEFCRLFELWVRDNFDVCINGGWGRNHGDMDLEFSGESPMPTVAVRIMAKDDEMKLDHVPHEMGSKPAHLSWVTDEEEEFLRRWRRGALIRADLDVLDADREDSKSERRPIPASTAEASNGTPKPSQVSKAKPRNRPA